MAIAANEGWHLNKFDVNNAFFHGELEEEVYLQKPPGSFMGKPRYANSRQLYSRLSHYLIEFGIIQRKVDCSLFTKVDDYSFFAMKIYVDDIIVASSHLASITSLKTFFNVKFKIKSLGDLKYFLGNEVSWSTKGIHLY